MNGEPGEARPREVGWWVGWATTLPADRWRGHRQRRTGAEEELTPTTVIYAKSRIVNVNIRITGIYVQIT
jgi:hypothetical protein